MNYVKFTPIVNLLYIMFQRPTSARELPKNPANQAKFAQFAHISHKLCEFHAFCTKFIIFSSLVSDLWPSTENPGKLERINQIPHSSPTTSANYAKFTESAPCQQTRSQSRELQRLHSERRKFCAIRTMHQQIMRNSQHLHTNTR